MSNFFQLLPSKWWINLGLKRNQAINKYLELNLVKSEAQSIYIWSKSISTELYTKFSQTPFACVVVSPSESHVRESVNF
jgi:hypothetical protein